MGQLWQKPLLGYMQGIMEQNDLWVSKLVWGGWIDGPCGTSHWPFHTCHVIQIKAQTCSYNFWWNKGYRCWGEMLHHVRVPIFFASKWVMEPCHPMLVYSRASNLFLIPNLFLVESRCFLRFNCLSIILMHHCVT